MSLGISPGDDPHAILGVERAASRVELRRAFVGLSRKFHPDKDQSTSPAVATARFQRLRAAYELLTTCTASPRTPSTSSSARAFGTSNVSRPPCARFPARMASASATCAAPAKNAAAAEPAPVSRKRLSATDNTAQRAKPAKRARQAGQDRPAAQTSDTTSASAPAVPVRKPAVQARAPQSFKQAQILADRAWLASTFTDEVGTGVLSSDAASYVRVGFHHSRGAPITAASKARQASAAPLAEELEAAFSEWAARAVSVGHGGAVLAVKEKAVALQCVLAFQGWQKKGFSKGVQKVLRSVDVIIAPVLPNGRTLRDLGPTLAATQRHVVELP